jgi:hypothetical protein
VQAGDSRMRLDYASAGALSLRGARLLQPGDREIEGIGLPLPGAFGSLGWNKDIHIAPAVALNDYAAWSVSIFGEVLDPDGDIDGDGMTNYEEFVAGTDPQDPDSVLQFRSFTKSNADATIEWQSVIGITYHLDYSASLIAPNWQPLASNIAGTGNIIQINVPFTGMVYRIRVEP